MPITPHLPGQFIPPMTDRQILDNAAAALINGRETIMIIANGHGTTWVHYCLLSTFVAVVDAVVEGLRAAPV